MLVLILQTVMTHRYTTFSLTHPWSFIPKQMRMMITHPCQHPTHPPIMSHVMSLPHLTRRYLPLMTHQMEPQVLFCVISHHPPLAHSPHLFPSHHHQLKFVDPRLKDMFLTGTYPTRPHPSSVTLQSTSATWPNATAYTSPIGMTLWLSSAHPVSLIPTRLLWITWSV